MIRCATLYFVIFLLLSCNPLFSDLDECYSNIDCVSGTACNLSTNTCIASIIDASVSIVFSLENIGSEPCDYQFNISNNGPSLNRPLITLQQNGTISSQQTQDILIAIDLRNFNTPDVVDQTIVISEANQLIQPIDLRVTRTLGCNGCRTTNLYGGNCPQTNTCGGCCSPTNQCIQNVDTSTCTVGGLCSACIGTPTASTLSLDISAIKLFQFSWTESSHTDFYTLLESLDGNINSREIATNITSTRLDLSVPIYARIDGSYTLMACNAARCTNSNTITVDETLSDAIGYIKASNTDSDDQFGASIAVSGNGQYLAVGAPFEASNAQEVNGDQSNDSANGAGAVYLFHKENNTWVQQAYIKSSNNRINPFTGRGDNFGTAVQLNYDGDILAVGSPGEDSSSPTTPEDDSATGSGAVYIYQRSDGDWTEQALLKASTIDDGDAFGASIALNRTGDTLVVGARFEDSAAEGINPDNGQSNDSSPDSGAIYVLTRENDLWQQQAYIKPDNTKRENNFGEVLAISQDGHTIAVGVPQENSNAIGIDGDGSNNNSSKSGAVYIYFRSNDVWVQQSYIKASDAQSNGEFGKSLSLNQTGDILAVGSPENKGAGKTYVLSRQNETWTEDSIIAPETLSGPDSFGTAVSLTADGKTIAVSAPGDEDFFTGFRLNFDDTELRRNSGTVYTFHLVDGQWTQQSQFKHKEIDSGDLFGTTLSLSYDGNILAVGAPFESSNATGIGNDETNNSDDDSGAVFLY